MKRLFILKVVSGALYPIKVKTKNNVNKINNHMIMVARIGERKELSKFTVLGFSSHKASIT